MPVSGWRRPAMKITLGFSLQTGQFVKNARLLFWCQTLKLRRRDQQKEQKRSSFLSNLWNMFLTFCFKRGGLARPHRSGLLET